MAAMNNVLMMRRVLWGVATPQLRPNCFSSKPPKQCGSVGFKCVSNQNQNQNNVVLVKRQVKKKEEEKGGAIETRFSILKHPFTAIDESCLVGPPFQNSTIHGHSHGILCFSTNLNDLFLYNPTTRELRKLPPSILIFPDNIFQGVHSHTTGVGFGYDPKSKDLKVVRIVEFYAHTQDTSWPYRAEVYDLGNDGWREIKTPIPSHPAHLSSFDMYYQGCYYWWASSFDFPQVILSFDFTKEVFAIISMPLGLSYPKLFTRLAVFNESIVMFNYPSRGNEKSFDLWKMVKDEDDDDDDDEVVVSWTKLFTIGPLFGICDPLAFVSSDELLMTDNEGQLILCNIFNIQHQKPLPIKGEPVSFQATLFHNTALSVKGGGGQT